MSGLFYELIQCRANRSVDLPVGIYFELTLLDM